MVSMTSAPIVLKAPSLISLLRESAVVIPEQPAALVGPLGEPPDIGQVHGLKESGRRHFQPVARIAHEVDLPPPWRWT